MWWQSDVHHCCCGHVGSSVVACPHSQLADAHECVKCLRFEIATVSQDQYSVVRCMGQMSLKKEEAVISSI